MSFELVGDDVGGGPVGGLGVQVESDAVGGLDVDVEAVEEQEGRVVLEVLCGGLDGDGAGLSGDEGDVVVGVEDGEDAAAGLLLVELEVGHQGDGWGGVVESDSEDGVVAFDVGCDGGVECGGGEFGQASEVVLGDVLPIEVGGEEFAGRVGEV